MAELPRLQAAMPPAIKIFTLSDRTQTIRASVHDVQFTLLLTIALVVMVIFIFLRNVWATIIPSVTVPLALLGACALMWFAGYSLDNLSLMALTIAVGFVVDDAIVMLENITRYIEEGEKPLAAALKGSREIGFTIVSISISLVAVLIPLLLMGGIIGRLFREFAVTLSMAIVVSAFVSLTLTPMMASRFLNRASEAQHGRLYADERKRLRRAAQAYARGLDVVLKFRFITLCVFLRDAGALRLSVRDHSQGLLPAAGYRPDHRHVRGGAGYLVCRHDAASASARRDRPQGSGRRTCGDVHRRLGQCARTPAACSSRLKPREERHATADQIIARLRPQLAKVEGAKLFLQAAQDLNVGGRASRTQFQFTLQGSDLSELNEWAPKMLAKMQELPELRDVATDQQTKERR